MAGDILINSFKFISRKAYVRYTPGMFDHAEYRRKDVVLERWGIRDDAGHEIMMGWKRNGLRKTSETGWVGGSPRLSPYHNKLLYDMFKGWY